MPHWLKELPVFSAQEAALSGLEEQLKELVQSVVQYLRDGW